MTRRVPGPNRNMRRRYLNPERHAAGLTLIELLCTITIIAILVALFTPTALRALQRVRAFAGEVESPGAIDELQSKLSRHFAERPASPALSLDELIQVCRITPGCERFLRSKWVTYHPVSGADPGDKVVLVVRDTSGRTSEYTFYTKSVLVPPPEEDR